MKSTVSHLPIEEREAREAYFEEISRDWKEGEEKKEIDDARCSACKKKTASDPDNVIIICDGCVGGALHFRCTKFPLKAIPRVVSGISCCGERRNVCREITEKKEWCANTRRLFPEISRKISRSPLPPPTRCTFAPFVDLGAQPSHPCSGEEADDRQESSLQRRRSRRSARHGGVS